MKEVLYKYYRSNDYYYAQGIHEPYVRQALATKIGVDINELSIGVSDIPQEELDRVSDFSINYSRLDNSLDLKQSYKKSIHSICKITGHSKEFVKSKICYHLNIPRDIVDSLHDRDVIVTIVKHSNTKIKIRTHKVCNIASDDIMQERVVSRIDEINNHINMLLSLDYNIFFEIDDLEYELYRAKSSYDNLAEKMLSTSKSSPAYLSMEKKCTVFREEIQNYGNLLHMKYNRVFSTGYYVSDKYLHDNYDEVIEGFRNMYNKLNSRILRGYLQDIVPEGEEFTLKEKLDSFMLFDNY